MKKLVALVAALVLALTCTAVFAEAKTEYNVGVLVWKFDDTYGSTVRKGMMDWAEKVGDELGVKINLDMQDAGDIGRRDHDCKRILALVAGGEIAGFDPLVVTAFLDFAVIILLCQILFHFPLLIKEKTPLHRTS